MGFQVVLLMLQQNRISIWVWSLPWQKGKNRDWAWGNICFGLVEEIRKYTLNDLFWLLFLILQHWLRSFSIGKYSALVQFKVTRKVWLLWRRIKIWKEVTSSFNLPITCLLWNGLITMEWEWLVHVLRNVIKYQQLHVDKRRECQNTCPVPRDYQRFQLRYG